jgi:glycosyltransferase involved in cell wall biosynthesis
MILSIVVTAYKFEDYIIQCIDSILSQKTNFEFEVIIRDDFSGDRTNEILIEKFSEDRRVIILESKENVGVYDNFSILLKNAKGKYISFIDGDDYLNNPDKLQMQIDFLEGNPDYVMHSTGYVSLMPDGTFDPIEPGYNKFPRKNEVNTDDLKIFILI